MSPVAQHGAADWRHSCERLLRSNRTDTGLAVLAWLLYALPFFNVGLYVADEGFEGVAGQLILDGQRPFVDFAGLLPAPLGALLHAAVISVSGPYLVAWRVVFLLVGAGITILTHRLLLRIAPRACAGAGVLLAIVTVNAGLPPYWWYNYTAALCGLSALYALVVAQETRGASPRLTLAALTGVAVVATFLAKPNIGAALAVALPIGLLPALVTAATRRTTGRLLLALTAGATVTLAAATVAMQGWGILDGYLDTLAGAGTYAEGVYGKHRLLDYLHPLFGSALVGEAAWPLVTIHAGLALAVTAGARRLARGWRHRLGLAAGLLVIALAAAWDLDHLQSCYALTGLWLILELVLSLAHPGARTTFLAGPMPLLLAGLGALWLADPLVQPSPPIAWAGGAMLLALLAARHLARLSARGLEALGVTLLLALVVDAVLLKWQHPYRHPPLSRATAAFSAPALTGLRGVPRFVRETDAMLALVDARPPGSRVLFYPDNFLFYVAAATTPPVRAYSLRPGAFADATGALAESLAALDRDPPALVVEQLHKDVGAREQGALRPYATDFPRDAWPRFASHPDADYQTIMDSTYYRVLLRRGLTLDARPDR